MAIHIDEGLENQDWMRGAGWDLGLAEDWERMPLEQVRRFMHLPAFDQAPPEVREVAVRRTSPSS